MNTILEFIFSNLNAIILVIWFLFLIIVAIRFFRPNWVKNISYFKLFYITLGVHVLYSLFLTWAQYYVWSITDPSGTFNKLSYFLGYAFIHFWLSLVLLSLISGILYFLFRLWLHYRGGFTDEGPMLLLVLMLISGWPGVLVSVTLGFIFAVLFFIFSYIKNIRNKDTLPIISIEGFFILSTLIALLFTKVIMFYML